MNVEMTEGVGCGTPNGLSITQRRYDPKRTDHAKLQLNILAITNGISIDISLFMCEKCEKGQTGR